MHRLLPTDLMFGQIEVLPPIHFRTLNGYRLWLADLPQGEEETDSLRIRRVYEVRAPDRQRRLVAVDIATSVRGRIQDLTGCDYPPSAVVWEAICRSSLSDYLRAEDQLPPENILVYSLTAQQNQTVRALAGLGP